MKPQNYALNDEQLYHYAPSIFADRPADRVSDEYSFIPTIDIVNKLRDNGLFPVFAKQSSVKDESREGFQKQMIRFRREEDLRVLNKGDILPEVVITNSHDGLSSYQLMAGIMRCWCDNQCCVGESTFPSIRVRHKGFDPDDVIEASYRIIEDVPKVMDKVEDWKNLPTDKSVQMALAEASLKLRWDDKAPIDPEHLLLSRRHADKDEDLWTIYNRIQENLIRGGVKNYSNRKARRTLPIKSIDQDIKINRNLWDLTSNLYEMVA
ncbi:MAG: DUF932 domain-containing protein [Bacteriovoracaceae bacterium]